MIATANSPESSRLAGALLAALAVAGLLLAGSYRGPAPRPVAVSSPPPSAAVGGWEIAGASLTLYADGTWTGFDGCNRRRGNWLELDEGRFAASSTPAARRCGAVDLGALLTSATRVEVGRGRLLLSDTKGRRWELSRSGAPAVSATAVAATSRVRVGIACPLANSIRCGRVGIAVWPEGAVDHLVAQIGSYVATLHRTGDFYAGYVDAGDLAAPPFAIRASAAGQWLGDPPASVDVRVSGSADGLPIDVTFRTEIAAGWG